MKLQLPVTDKELADCIAKHREVLTHKIRECGRSEPPSDGAIITIIRTLKALEDIQPKSVLDQTYVQEGE
jgi:hypothetical protein